MESLKTGSEWLNYHHLRYFHAVASDGSISRAAQRLNASQPSICAQIKQLESALGETLYRRSGRSIALTDFGRTVFGYADEIFSLGRELLTTARRAPTKRPRRLHVGVVDSFPKLLSLQILRPVFSADPSVRLICQEGKIDDLLGQLCAHRLDVLLADEPPPSGAQVKTFQHTLGSSGITFCAAESLSKQLGGRFPQNLNHAPLLLPTQNTALRRELERWFREKHLTPNVVAEFEDAALAKIVAADGAGVAVVPTTVLPQLIQNYGLVPIGKTDACKIRLYLITAERRIEHPTITMILHAWSVRAKHSRLVLKTTASPLAKPLKSSPSGKRQ